MIRVSKSQYLYLLLRPSLQHPFRLVLNGWLLLRLIPKEHTIGEQARLRCALLAQYLDSCAWVTACLICVSTVRSLDTT